jgi:predicted nucleic acid-binding Zn ribbon protein
MDLDDQLELEHLLFFDRKCRKCGQIKTLMNDFYLTRKNKSSIASSYSYECKECTIKRVSISRMTSKILDKWEYPDW